MAKTKISEFDSTAANNTDINNINIAEGCAPSGINNAIREMMAQLKNFQSGTSGDSFTNASVAVTGGTINGTAIGGTTPAAGAFTTLASSSTATLNGTTIPASATLAKTADKLSVFAATTSAELAGVISDETGTGALVFGTSPTIGTPTLNTPTVNTPAISGGTINNTVIGGTTRAAGNFTTLDANGNVVLGDATADTVSVNGRVNTDVVPSTDNARDLGATALKWKQIFATTFTENGSAIVAQTDIGTAPNEIPLNQYLGNLAFMGSDQLVVNPAASAVPSGIGDMVFQLTDNTTLVVKVKGSDGVIRSATLTLA